jgi:U5 snRNP spliceosome subunit
MGRPKKSSPPPAPPAPPPPPPAPTAAEVSQASATDMDNKGIKRRRRGRSSTILTGSYGVQEGATLGTPTLLG